MVRVRCVAFLTITFPLLSPTTFFLIVINLVYAFFDTFAIIHATTEGGPADATSVLVFRVYNTGFIGQDYGSSAAQSVVLMMLVIPMTAIQFRYVERRVVYFDGHPPPHADNPAHLVLITGVCIIVFPVWMALVASTHPPEALSINPIPMWFGTMGPENYTQLLSGGIPEAGGVSVGLMMTNSLIMALLITIGKIAVSLIAAFAIVYFRFRFRFIAFWLIFITLMLPVEVRILPTFDVVASLGMLNSYTGLCLPLIASVTATFLFRQFFMTIPAELVEAAKMDQCRTR